MDPVPVLRQLTTAARKIREGRGDLVRATFLRSLFPAALFRYNEILIMRMTDIRPLPRPLKDFRVRPANPDDEMALQSVRRRREGYQSQFEAGHLCTLGEVGGRPASFIWFELGDWHASASNAYRFHIGPGGCWNFGSEVKPRYRMSGIFHKHWVEARELLASRGVSRIYGAIEEDNPHSFRSHVRLGFREIYRMRVLRIAGLTHHAARPGKGTSLPGHEGLGRWTGWDHEYAPPDQGDAR